MDFSLGCLPKYIIAEVPTCAFLLSQPLPDSSFRKDMRLVAFFSYIWAQQGAAHTEADLETTAIQIMDSQY